MKYPITTERADLFEVNPIIGMEVAVKGEAGMDAVRQAFEAAVGRHEILNTRVALESSGEAYYVNCERGSNSLVFAEKTTAEIFAVQEKKRFRIEDGEFLRAFVRQGQGSFTVLFLMHHLGGDGKSLVYFIETFFRALNGESLPFYPIRLLTPDSLPSASKPTMAVRLVSNYLNNQWAKERRTFTFDDLQRGFDAFWAHRSTSIEVTSYPAEKVEALKSEARAAGCHLTAYMLTKYLQREEFEKDIGIAVDARPDGNRSMGNQATGISVKTAYKSRRSFEKNAVRVQKMMDKKLSVPSYKYLILHLMASFDPPLLDAVNLQKTGTYQGNASRAMAEMFGYGEKTKDLSVTNLTLPDIPMTYGNYEIEDMIFIPPVISYGKNIVGIITCNGKMNVVNHRYTL